MEAHGGALVASWVCVRHMESRESASGSVIASSSSAAAQETIAFPLARARLNRVYALPSEVTNTSSHASERRRVAGALQSIYRKRPSSSSPFTIEGILLPEAELRPDQLAVAPCLERGIRVAEEAGLDLNGVITSRDESVLATKDSLVCDSVSDYFQRWQLPVHVDGTSINYVSVGEPGSRVPEHAHEGASLRFIISGSLIYEGTELIAGDWIYIPSEHPYSFEVGPYGVSLVGDYSCCCG
jgi:hypothetical protein